MASPPNAVSDRGNDRPRLREPSTTTDVSIIVCTFNRAAMLADTLSSWSGVDLQGLTTELIVVDNASTDVTPEVVAEATVKYSDRHIRYVYERKPGLSQARNTGIAIADGRIIAFVDDDIFFSSGWLQHVCAAFAQQPTVDCVGGCSIPLFERDRPAWISDAMLKFYGSTGSGDEDRPMTFPEHPYGVNMAFRRAVFERVGKFSVSLGRKGTSLLSNEEKEFFYRVHAAGLRVWYAAGAVLHHRVPAERVTEQWLLRRAYWQGISGVIFDRHVGRSTRLELLRESLRCAKRIAMNTRSSSPLARRRQSLPDRLQRRYLWGVLCQSAVEFVRPKLHQSTP